MMESVPERQGRVGEAGAKRYQAIKVRLTVVDALVSLAIIAVIAFSGISRFLAAVVADFTMVPYFQFLLFVGCIGVTTGIIGLPLDFYGSYVVEHRFGLSRQTVASWIGERVKSLIIGLVIGIPVGLAFYYFLIATGAHWWIVTGLFLFLAMIVLARVAPQIIFPLFYTFTPLEEGEVARRLRAMVEDHGIGIRGVYSFNLGRDTRKANAGFAGVGRARRIIISDTLLERFTPDEIAVVFAHELGHYAGRHIAKNMLLGGAVIFASLFVCGTLYEWTMHRYGFFDHHDLAALPILFFYLAVFGLAIVPLTNAISRRFENEADAYALRLVGGSGAFISCMEKLADLNLADVAPHPLIELLLYSHPSIGRRIARARAFKIPGV